MDWWRILHTVSLIWLGAGLGATYLPVLKAWSAKDLRRRSFYMVEAAANETKVLLPGVVATGATGFFWGVAAEYHLFKDAWFGVLAILYVFFWLVCLPLFGFGLRRARLAVLIAEKRGEDTPELLEVLADRVPLVFGAILVLSVPLMSWVAIFKPF